MFIMISREFAVEARQFKEGNLRQFEDVLERAGRGYLCFVIFVKRKKKKNEAHET